MADNTIRYISHVKRMWEALNIPMWILKPEKKTVKGSTKYIYPETGEQIFVSFRSFGGTEKVVNDVLAIENTAVIDTWYRPDITSDCRLMDKDGRKYEILGTPENMQMRNQYLRFKVRQLEGEP